MSTLMSTFKYTALASLHWTCSYRWTCHVKTNRYDDGQISLCHHEFGCLLHAIQIFGSCLVLVNYQNLDGMQQPTSTSTLFSC